MIIYIHKKKEMSPASLSIATTISNTNMLHVVHHPVQTV